MGPHFDQGIYKCEVTAQGFDVSKDKKTPFFWLAFTPLVMTKGDMEREVDHYERAVRMYLTDNTVDFVMDRLCDMGWDGCDWADLEPGGDHTFVGREITLQCRHEEFSNGLRETWEFPRAGMTTPESRRGVAKKLNALFGRQLKKGPSKPRVPEEDDGEEDTDDEGDLPF